jgi:hypothetical protein
MKKKKMEKIKYKLKKRLIDQNKKKRRNQMTNQKRNISTQATKIQTTRMGNSYSKISKRKMERT